MTTIVGIDPGLDGGLASIGGPEFVVKMPLAGGWYDVEAISDIVHSADLVVMEACHAMPKQGVSSSFKFGRGCGLLEGVVRALRVRFELVSPQAWKKVVLGGTLKDKAAAIQYARRAYPHLKLVPPGCRTPHDGMAEAICLGEYGRRVLLGQAPAVPVDGELFGKVAAA